MAGARPGPARVSPTRRWSLLLVLSPAAGTVTDLSEVPDPVFARGMVGPGAAVVPGPRLQEASAPISGRLARLHPHAFVVVDGERGRGVLVHLGIDTVKLGGEGFEKLAEEGEHVEAGAPLIRWTPGDVRARGLSAALPVVALDAPAEAVSGRAAGPVGRGEVLFRWAGADTTAQERPT